eukprot:856004-Pelagomonas_calceolata.AAC.3
MVEKGNYVISYNWTARKDREKVAKGLSAWCVCCGLVHNCSTSSTEVDGRHSALCTLFLFHRALACCGSVAAANGGSACGVLNKICYGKWLEELDGKVPGTTYTSPTTSASSPLPTAPPLEKGPQ